MSSPGATPWVYDLCPNGAWGDDRGAGDYGRSLAAAVLARLLTNLAAAVLFRDAWDWVVAVGGMGVAVAGMGVAVAGMGGAVRVMVATVGLAVYVGPLYVLLGIPRKSLGMLLTNIPPFNVTNNSKT